MQKPSPGRIVLVTVDPHANNGSDVAPAVITRVWSDTCVNVRVLYDSQAIDWKTSIMLFPDREAVDARRAEQEEQFRKAHGGNASNIEPGPAAYWPSRV